MSNVMLSNTSYNAEWGCKLLPALAACPHWPGSRCSTLLWVGLACWDRGGALPPCAKGQHVPGAFCAALPTAARPTGVAKATAVAGGTT